jgi:nanoRNase/pAp phosphatase (c-di-AMP/oligoRNAs hydrolase)
MHNPNPGMDWFWLLRDKADVFARVAFDGRNYSVSLYSEKVDVEEIARQFGGGGHSGAAGFVSPTFPWAPTSKL